MGSYHITIGAKIGWEGYYTYPGESKHYSESIGITQTFIEILNKTDCKSSWSTDWGSYTYNKTSPSTEYSVSLLPKMPLAIFVLSNIKFN